MTEVLTVEDFARFYEAVHEHPPFQWQEVLAAGALRGEWPAVIDIPTAMGKTSVIDVAVFALAAQSHLQPAQRTAATRTFVVINRRIVVDDITRHAEKLAAALASSGDDLVGDVAQRLRTIGDLGPQTAPLTVVRMRGGTTWDWRWVRQPDQPAVVVGTIDQYGSRLLLRGYGVSPPLRPIDAALVGNDALLVVDEAHLAGPLLQTVRAVARYEHLAEQSLLPARRLRVVEMSATSQGERDGLRLDADAEIEHSPEARRRLTVVKRAELIDLPKLASRKAGAPERRRQLIEFSKGLVELATEAVSDIPHPHPVVGVVVNTVGCARAVFDELLKHDGSIDRLLLIGRCRNVERDLLMEEWMDHLRAGRDPSARKRLLFVVATQTIEVGADVDFDLLVTEAAPIDSLVQRFGRVNRVGRLNPARSFVVHAGFRHRDDVVYGGATEATWEWLTDRAGGATRLSDVKRLGRARALLPWVDFGPLAMRDLLDQEGVDGLLPSEPLTPVVLGPHLDAWARTEPAPVPDQPVAPFLHGMERGVPEVSFVWRADLPEKVEGWKEVLDVLPPVSAESVAVPLWEARAFLARQTLDDGVADIETFVGDEPEMEAQQDKVLEAFVYEGSDREGSHVCRPQDLRPGATVVVRSSAGGHDRFGWLGAAGSEENSEPVLDVADIARQGRKRVLRLQSSTLAPLLGVNCTDVQAVLEEHLDEEGMLDRDWMQVRRALQALYKVFDPVEGNSIATRALDVVRQLKRTKHPRLKALAVPSSESGETSAVRGVLVTATIKDEGTDPDQAPLTDMASSDEQEGASSLAPEAITLVRHNDDVGRRVADFARRLGFEASVVEALRLAGQTHDLGKADRRFQVMLHGGDALQAEVATEPLAKSADVVAGGGARRDTWKRSGLPDGFRHEAVSARLVQAMFTEHPERFAEVDRELIVHLVAAHHGCSRPLLPPLLDVGAPEVVGVLDDMTATTNGNESQVDWSAPRRFARLCGRYGRWGLALLEATLRLADIACSEEYEQKAGS